MKRLLALLLLLPWALAQGLTLRVLLKEVPLGEALRLDLPSGRVLAKGVEGGVVVDGRLFPSFLHPGPTFALDGTPYRGGLLLLPQGEKVMAVNAVDLEDYLLGVLPGEMPPSFPLEALKTQAVLARTFAVNRLSPSAPYDLCATEACQVYRGLSAETPRHKEAVLATRGLVVSYGGRAISALYHADSGGMTAGSEEVFQKALPYLRPREDPFSDGPKSRWTVDLTPERVAAALRAYGLAPRTLEPPEVLALTPSGRVGRLSALGVVVEGPLAQRVVRAMGLPSALVRFEGWRALGRGAGHGVGMSQWGAKGMAERGFEFREILGHYFPGTFLSDLVVRAGLP
ncbi:SpoIID/LytB domain protein [Thermus oshimai JL-2]|uniref:SpoIID/LytB domain protein n=1 Tax=Thermus oshimai JL-2 TaxID=751945 RepID=K7QWA5_THEOS|nr:SpoIID/LytB domain-containing protein [Thermus oshimai]AFV75698.1 SpoIID/LytB domain protein [Thermus oshimai JL-2]